MPELICAPPGQPSSRIQIGAHTAMAELEQEIAKPNAFVLIDARVAMRHPRFAGAEPGLALPGGEAIKSLTTLEEVLRQMARGRLDRGARLIAIGGGTIGDLGGLAASLYSRGIELVQAPTSTLAMLDSSVGGKTAVNLPEGKNLAGHFWPAARVLIDPGFLATLPLAEHHAGLAEAVKMAIGLDEGLFDLLEREVEGVRGREPEVVEKVITAAVAAKIRVVESDPTEQGPRRLLNLGHTLGHALEAHSDWGMRHGEAVGRGVHFAVDVAERRGKLGRVEGERCRNLLRSYGFEATPLPPREELAGFLGRDKKVEGEGVHMVLPVGVGRSETVWMGLGEVLAGLG